MAAERPVHFMHMSLGDWAHGTAGFTLEQEGFALRLHRSLYEANGYLPDDDARNARRLHVDPRAYRRLKQFLLDENKIEILDGNIVHRGVLRDLEAAKTRREARSQIGRNGAATRKAKVIAEITGLEDRAEVGPTSAGSPGNLSLSDCENPCEINTATMHSFSPSFSFNKEPLTPSNEGPSEVRDAFDAYNATAARLGLAVAKKLTTDRVRKIKARLDDYGLEGWLKALGEIERSPFLLGKTQHAFTASLNFICQPTSFGNLHDGGYSNATKPRLQLLDFGDGETSFSRYSGGRT